MSYNCFIIDTGGVRKLIILFMINQSIDYISCYGYPVTTLVLYTIIMFIMYKFVGVDVKSVEGHIICLFEIFILLRKYMIKIIDMRDIEKWCDKSII